MSWVAVAIGAGVGLLKATAIDAPKADRERKLASETQRYAPWTGLAAQPVHEADALGSAIQFGSTGAMMGQGIKNANAAEGLAKSQNELTKAQTGWLNRGGSPGTTAAMATTAAPAALQAGPSMQSNPWQGQWGQSGPVAKSYNPWTF